MIRCIGLQSSSAPPPLSTEHTHRGSTVTHLAESVAKVEVQRVGSRSFASGKKTKHLQLQRTHLATYICLEHIDVYHCIRLHNDKVIVALLWSQNMTAFHPDPETNNIRFTLGLNDPPRSNGSAFHPLSRVLFFVTSSDALCC